MKKIFKKMLFAMMMSSTIVLTGCGFSMDENYVITNITKEELPNGDVLLTIIYEDEEMEPTTVVIPKGAPGEDGNDGVGIEKIEPTQSGDGLYTILTITYTNNETKTVRVPNGISIVGISTPTLDENGNMVFSFIYSNGEQSDPISIPKGEKGQDGIDGREVEFNVTDTHIQWRYVSDDPENQNEWQDLVALSELTGTGIKSVDIKESDNKGNNKFFVEVIYTNGDVVNIPLDDINRWYSENYSPSSKDGYDGDMWYDKSMNIIYVKENGFWIELINLSKETQVECTVTFDFNVSPTDPDKPTLPAGTPLSYTIYQGQTFYDSDTPLPNPTRNGYEFVGWYTTKIPTAVNGIFTDLTIVTKEQMTLYAKWEKTTEENEKIEDEEDENNYIN